MSLPTPPGTSHRDKENRQPFFPATARVAWSELHEIHTVFPDSPRRVLVESSASKELPTRSILKKPTYALPPLEESEREPTPEPEDPLTNLYYLESPVSRILAADAALRDLIEAYNVLAARLRACVSGAVDADASWPLFQPLRKNREALVEAMVRDLGRALEDPKETVVAPAIDPFLEDEIMKEEQPVGLPSPKQSPKRKKKGMSEEQVKHARDLCTTSHSVLKLLSAVFTMPAVYGILTDDQLRFLMTSVLAIPLMRELPTPNARKTCALAIWLIQVQRLPGDVLAPIKDDIAYALGRGIGGELGKEGKKGSATDGLKAIHDLCVYYPEIFVPAFTDLLPSIFSSLLAPTLVLRTQACHALGGFSLAAASIPTNAMHTHIANHVAEFLTKTPLGTPSKKPASPSKDPAIVRTLRTTLGATDPKHVAQGPVWALSVIANFIVLLRSTVYLQEKLTKCITSLFSLAMRHPKSSVRGLGCLVWRCMTWAYFQPPPIKIPTTRDDAEAPSQNINTMDWNMEYTAAERAAYIRRMDETWDVVKSVTDMGAGIATMGATLAIDVCDDPETPLRRTFSILSIMSKKGGLACKEALDTACHFVNPDPQVEDDSMLEWNPIKLLPPALFSANPGLLTAEYNVLNQAVKPILAQCPGLEDMRRLTRDELTTPWVFSAVLNVWKEGLASLKVVWGAGFPNEIRDVWSGLFRANACSLSDAGEEEILLELAHRAVDILIIILKNNKINLSAKSESEDEQSTIPWINPKKRLRAQATPRELHVYRWKPALKLALVRELWLSVRSIFPGSMLLEPARKLLACLNAKEANMVIELDVTDDVRAQWAYLCAEVAFVCDDSELMGFWREEKHSRQWSAKMHSFVFSHFVYKWREDLASWESSVALLSTPFMNSWEMKNDDLDEWDALLRLTMDRALDYGVDSITVVDQVAAAISAHHSPTHVSSTRIADLLLSHLDITDARHIPTGLFEFINDTLVSTYPPEPRNKVPSIWLLRTLTRTMDACPVEFAETLLELVQDGLCLWISDEYQSLDHSEYAMDVLPVYQTATLCIMSLPRNIETLARLAPVLVSAFSGREDKPEGPIPAFQEMWEAVYATESEPADGWPEKLLHCLRATGIKEVEATVPPAAVPDDIPEDSDTQDDDEVDAQLGYNVPSDDGSLSPVIPSPRTLELSNPFLLGPSTSLCSTPRASQITLRALPSTPHSGRPVSTPRRPRKSSSPSHLPLPGSLLLLHARPISPPLFPARLPVTPKRRTPNHTRIRSEQADKENISPLRVIHSVTERIAMCSPVASVLGKRRLDDCEDEGDETFIGSMKRNRTDTSTVFGSTFSDDCSEKSIQADMLFVPPAPANIVAVKIDAPSSPPSTPVARPKQLPSVLASVISVNHVPPLGHPPGDIFEAISQTEAKSLPKARKRKGVFLDAVEVPTLRELRRCTSGLQLSRAFGPALRPRRSLPMSFSQSTSTKSLSIPSLPLRKARSATKLYVQEDSDDSRYLPRRRSSESFDTTPSNRSTGKRKWSGMESDLDDLEFKQPSLCSTPSSSSSSPLRRLQDMEVIGSDDSVMLSTPCLTPSGSSSRLDEPLSSDDNPHCFIGQVTPHRLVSPAIRRTQFLDDAFEFGKEPGSDDSIMSASPTRDHIARLSNKGIIRDRILPLILDLAS